MCSITYSDRPLSNYCTITPFCSVNYQTPSGCHRFRKNNGKFHIVGGKNLHILLLTYCFVPMCAALGLIIGENFYGTRFYIDSWRQSTVHPDRMFNSGTTFKAVSRNTEHSHLQHLFSSDPSPQSSTKLQTLSPGMQK